MTVTCLYKYINDNPRGVGNVRVFLVLNRNITYRGDNPGWSEKAGSNNDLMHTILTA